MRQSSASPSAQLRRHPPFVLALAALAAAAGCPHRLAVRDVPALSADEALEVAERCWRSVDASVRLCAVDAAAQCPPSRMRPILEALTGDPDPVVRRAAAEALLGRKALKDGVAQRRGYADVLAAERRARELLDGIGRLRLGEQYHATQQLVALGWHAERVLATAVSDRNEVVALSARYARQEIDATRANVAPRWAQELTSQLATKTVSLDLEDTSLSAAAKALSEQTAVPIRVESSEGLPEGEPKVTLRVAGMTLQGALGWLTKLAGWQYHLKDGAVWVRRKECADGSATLFFDVRDFEAAGLRPDWRRLLASRVPDLDVRYWGSYLPWREGQGFENRGGILVAEFFVSAPDWGESERAAIAAYLGKLRELVKLDPARLRELEEADARGKEQD
ncbi:MAG: HEAT repeat domain-containing protein, partial [Planctomycetota bacterium]